MRTTILKVLVGSQAHGLADEDSDRDYRAVYVDPTSEILSLNHKYKGNSWIEGDEDNTAYEIGHFLHLATKCNPTILEVFKAPVVEANFSGRELRELFQYIWEPTRAFDAFTGYGFNQRKKFLDKKDDRQNKYAVAYIRTLYNLNELLMDGDFSVDLSKNHALLSMLKRYRNGEYTMGDIIDHSEDLIEISREVLEKCDHEPNIEKVNEFLIDVRRRYW